LTLPAPARNVAQKLVCTQGDICRLQDSVAAFGFGYLPGSIASDVLQNLQAEARERFASSSTAEQSDGLNYRANVISLGPMASKFLAELQLIDLLTVVFGETFACADQNSCFTFYKAGDHLGPHRDEPEAECPVTVIVYLAAHSPMPRSLRTGLVLRVYGEETTSIGTPRLTIPTRVGTIVVGRGSKVWHERPQLDIGESVDALTACYHRAS
jgi:hypothetical protein